MTSLTRWSAKADCDDFIGIVAPENYFPKDSSNNYTDEFGHLLTDGCTYRNLLAKTWFVLYNNVWYQQD